MSNKNKQCKKTMHIILPKVQNKINTQGPLLRGTNFLTLFLDLKCIFKQLFNFINFYIKYRFFLFLYSNLFTIKILNIITVFYIQSKKTTNPIQKHKNFKQIRSKQTNKSKKTFFCETNLVSSRLNLCP